MKAYTLKDKENRRRDIAMNVWKLESTEEHTIDLMGPRKLNAQLFCAKNPK